jgi:hypothetical protein
MGRSLECSFPGLSHLAFPNCAAIEEAPLKNRTLRVTKASPTDKVALEMNCQIERRRRVSETIRGPTFVASSSLQEAPSTALDRAGDVGQFLKVEGGHSPLRFPAFCPSKIV